jgi:tRNA G37 N-methylase TrmD
MIHYDIPEPVLSPNFTLDDIHKIREWNYERTKDATRKERLDLIHREAAEAWAQFDAYHAQKHDPDPRP